MKTCSHCNKQKKSFRTKNLCHACYQGISLNGKDYRPKVFKRDLLGTECIQCNKIREKESDIENKLCRNCYQKKRYKNNPDLHERHKKLCRNSRRRERGIDTELPLLCAPAGSGSIKKDQGYRVICKKEFRGMPHADKKGRIAEHTYVMMQHLGRPLKKGENVHHINGIRHDNRIENLELWHRSQPPGQRLDQKLEWCKSLLEEYGYKISKDSDNV